MVVTAVTTIAIGSQFSLRHFWLTKTGKKYKRQRLIQNPFLPEGDVCRSEAVHSEVAVGGVRGDAEPQRDLPRVGLPIPQQARKGFGKL